ncbi:M43 family zinc metalloprotease [Oscillatoria amoena NRMC-F 0135]|nr:M43 family zinc metalloprotease [Oscillatoria amoena NRMC-F 0135]
MVLPAYTQQRCGTVEYMNMLRREGKVKQTDAQFEQWLEKKKGLLRQKKEGARQQSGPYQVPVVVHVIHNGEPIGTGRNISDEQILSQLDVINKDFQRLNTDAGNTPPEFAPFAASLDIEFILAQRDPNGLPTSGIVRVNGGQSSWSISQETIFKSLSYWPAEDYLNIWVLNFAGGFIGYAQFPVSTMPGLEDYLDGDAETDGVVIDYEAFGSDDYGSFNLDPQFNKGRTLTHELGHFFGLRHIWGDATCGTDYVDDTPVHRSETTGCPAHPITSNCSGPVVKMFQNYLDYTDDACMNLFTSGQTSRMELILDDPSVPRRNSLLSSPGLLPPDCGILDVAIIEKITPGAVTCSANPPLKIKIRNYSCDPVNSVKINYSINSGSPLTTIFTGLSLNPNALAEVTLGTALLTSGINTISATVIEVNGIPDGKPENSTLTINVLVDNSSDKIPLRENFDELNWPVINPTDGTLWTTNPTNFSQSATFRAFDAPDGPNESWLTTPVLDFTNADKASVFFDLSYAWNTTKNDRLRILVSQDCGTSYQNLNPPFDKSGLQLANTISTESWQPIVSSDWQLKKYLNLSDYAGLDAIRLAFVFTNRNGNNIYLDNIEFFVSDNPQPVDIGEDLYSVYWHTTFQASVTFSLPERSTVQIDVVDIMGRSFISTTATDILNQTFPIDLGDVAAGIYILRVQIGSKFSATKFYLSR